MKKKFYRQAVIGTLMPGLIFFIAAFGIPGADARPNDFPVETPLWVGPYDIDINPELNIAFPDTGAAYWSAKLTIPEGATLELLCQFAHARYLSINAYDMVSGAPTDALHDVQIEPDPGSGAPRQSVTHLAGEGPRRPQGGRHSM